MPSRESEPDPGATNVAVLERGLAAFSDHRFEDGVAEMHPDVEWHVAFRLPDLPLEQEVCIGHDEVIRLWDAFRSAWDELVVALEEVLVARSDLVVARVRFRGRGSASGIEVDRSLFYVADIEDGLLRRLRPFDDEASARAAGTRPGT